MLIVTIEKDFSAYSLSTYQFTCTCLAYENKTSRIILKYLMCPLESKIAVRLEEMTSD